MKTSSTLLAFATVCLLSYQSKAQYTATNAFPSLPTYSKLIEMTFPNDGSNRLFLVQQTGIIRVINNDASVSTSRVYLDISDSVYSVPGEMGLLGMAFHPDYKNNGFFYVNYNRKIGTTLYTYVCRYTVSNTNPDSAVKTSKKLLLKFVQPYENHNGGCLRFGADGYLYIAQGDGGSSNDPGNRAQSLNTFLGKIHRIDVDNETVSPAKPYAIPADNPFVSTLNAYPEIYAYGLRNPWKMQFDPETGLLWAGDVGQGYREEIDIIEKGKNYGWKIMEGDSCRGGVNPCNKIGLQWPVIDYANGVNGNISVTGGEVYRGSAVADLIGKYIFGDYGSGRIYSLTYDAGVDTSYTQILDAPFNISAFAHDQFNELYVIGINTGIIYKLGKEIPTATSDETIMDNQRVTFYPNPVQDKFTMKVNKKQDGTTRVRLLGVTGNLVSNLFDSDLSVGAHTLSFDASSVQKGIYYVELQTEAKKSILKMVKE